MLIPYVDENLVLKYKAAFILSLYNFYSYAITKSINLDFLERRTTFLLLLRFYLSILDFKFCSEFSMLMPVTQKTLHELLIRNFKKKILKSCTAQYFGACTCT